VQVLSDVAKIVGKWISDPNSGLKITDKANLVNRMLSFEQGRNPAPYNIFLQVKIPESLLLKSLLPNVCSTVGLLSAF